VWKSPNGLKINWTIARIGRRMEIFRSKMQLLATMNESKEFKVVICDHNAKTNEQVYPMSRDNIHSIIDHYMRSDIVYKDLHIDTISLEKVY
jgi:thymidylate kinase